MFIEEYLQDLRRARFTPAAVALYLRRSAARMRECLVANPGAVRSTWSLALLYFALAFTGAAAIALAADRHLAYKLFAWTALGMLPTFTLVTLCLDLLRDRNGYRLSALNLPIALTLLRVTLLPAIVLFLAHERYALALSVFLFVSLTDVLDGWAARRFHQVTQLGTALDPIVDIVCNLTVFLAFAYGRLVPSWVAVAATLRYAVLLVGGAYLCVFVGPVRIRPTLFGRLTGVVMAALMAFLIGLRALEGRVAERLTPLTQVALGTLLCATVVYAVGLGWFNLRLMTGGAETPGRVVGDVRWGAR